ncbi:MAG: tetratricopeptide repeat protein [Alphaproteobacteria bacterium]|nr:tetratricopeptide repeat protein [Alphaproteobacteria bacterium]
MSVAPNPTIETAIAALVTAIDQCIALGEFTAARQLIDEGAKIAPAHAALRLRRGRLAMIGGDFTAAIPELRAVVAAEPANARAWLDLGRSCVRCSGWADAAAAFDTSLRLAGPDAGVLAELGHARANAGDHEGAIAALRDSLRLAPRQVDVWNDLGGRLMAAERDDEAASAFQRAVELQPDHPTAATNRAVAQEWMGGVDATLETRRLVLARKPDEPAARQALGAALLSYGRLDEGWALYRARLINPAHRGWHRGIPKPLWTGSSLARQRLLVWADQGLGDQILVSGLLSEAMATAAHIAFACEPRLIPLMARSFPGLRVVPITEIHLGTIDLADVEAHASISELGPALRPAMSSFPTHSGFLRPDAERVAALKAKYRALAGEGPVVGLSWRSAHDTAGKDKSVGLAEWAPILAVPGATFVSLQYGDVRSDISAAGGRLHVDSTVDAIADVDLFAAQVAAMDMVISVSNTTVHLAGALGVPTLCLTPKVEGRPWYWFAGAETSPWYPSVRHLWQTRRGRWDDVVSAASGLVAHQSKGA